MIKTILKHPSSGKVFDANGLYAHTMRRGINWIFVIALTGFHFGALAAMFYFQWSALAVFITLWIIAQNVGIAMGYHRL